MGLSCVSLYLFPFGQRRPSLRLQRWLLVSFVQLTGSPLQIHKKNPPKTICTCFLLFLHILQGLFFPLQ